MGLCDEVREHCALIAAEARFVRIEPERLGELDPGPAPELDAERHYLEGPPEDVAAYLLTLDTINFGSGWFPTLRKRPGCSGYFTVASALADRFRADGPFTGEELRTMDAAAIARVLGQDPDHELMALYARALRELAAFLAGRSALAAVEGSNGSAERVAERLADGMPMFRDPGFYKRAQIAAHDLALGGVARFDDLDRLTAFADNLVPHVLRVEGVLAYAPELAAAVDAGEPLAPGRQELEIRACAVHTCELIAARTGMPPRLVDNALWNRGQEPRFKAVPRHRTRTTAY